MGRNVSDVFSYDPGDFDSAINEMARINQEFEEDIDTLKTSLVSVLGCGNAGPIYESFVRMFDESIKPELEAMFHKDEDIHNVTQSSSNIYDSTTSDVIQQINKL